jgi:hypothetical protein
LFDAPAIVANTLLGETMIADDHERRGFPPNEPVGERTVDDDAFATECMTLMRPFAETNWELSKPVITRSEKWGLVCRVDFAIVGQDISPRVNRIVCWKKPDGEFYVRVSAGQDILPLHPAKSVRSW